MFDCDLFRLKLSRCINIKGHISTGEALVLFGFGVVLYWATIFNANSLTAKNSFHAVGGCLLFGSDALAVVTLYLCIQMPLSTICSLGNLLGRHVAVGLNHDSLGVSGRLLYLDLANILVGWSKNQVTVLERWTTHKLGWSFDRALAVLALVGSHSWNSNHCWGYLRL